MRISDWSSDVCSSDLFGKMMRRLFPDRHLAATDPDVVKHGAASGHDSDDVGEHGARRGPHGFPPAIELACEYSSNRSEESRVGQASVITLRSRWSWCSKKNKRR